jgi:hypothetical protein
MAYGARSATIGSTSAHHISRDSAVVPTAFRIGDDRNRHFAEYHTIANLKSKDAIPVNYCTPLCFDKKTKPVFIPSEVAPHPQRWHTRRRNSARWERPNKLDGCILFDNRNCCVFLNSI